mgnify:CR=1 FL=1
MPSRAETLHPCAAASHKPQNDVHIMAGFGENHGAALLAGTPVAAHKAMALVNISDAFGVYYIHDFAELSRIDYLLYHSQLLVVYNADEHADVTS